MRIALFTDTFRPTLNGVARALGLLVDHAKAAGHQVALVTPDIDGEDWPAADLHIRIPGMELPFYRELKAARPWMTGREVEALDEFAPEIVHSAVEALVGMAGRSYAKSRGLPFVTSYCTNFAEYMAGYRMGFLEGTVWSTLRWFHSEARTTFAPSHATLDDLRAHDFHDRLAIWSRGVDAELFDPARRSAEIREAMCPGAEVILTYVGRMAPEKKIDLLMEAFPRIRERSSKTVGLMLVGGGPALERLKAMKVDGVSFAGYRTGEDLGAHFASGDVFIFGSDTETFGQVVTEAMASGLPAIAPARGGVQDTVIPGETGYLFAPGSVDDLVEKALRVVEDDAHRRELSANARRAAETRSWGEVFDRLFTDYAAAIRGKALSGRDATVTGSSADGVLADRD